MMSDEALVVLTFKSVETCLDPGVRGTQAWSLDRAHAMRCRYAVLCRNGKHPDVEDKKPHGTAFLIGRIADVVPSTETKGRWLVTFSEYAEIDAPKLWQALAKTKGGRNPVCYTTIDDLVSLGITLDRVQFQPMPPRNEEGAKYEMPPLGLPLTTLTIAEAKKALAATFGINPDAVEIIIHG
jgi:hypothetical protein